MKILLTGGSGDLGTLLSLDLAKRGHEVVNIDLAQPKAPVTRFVQGSIIDRSKIAEAMQDVDCVIHIAAWHGIHEGIKSPAEFHDLNVTGTFNTLQAAVDAKVRKFIFISSTSADNKASLYGNTKIIGEEMVAAYAARNPDVTFMTLRPRAFIPHWNKSAYKNFIEWADWFMKGSVHIDDFRDSVLIALDLTPAVKAPIYVIDGAHEYTAKDLENWNDDTFSRHYPDDVALAQQYGLNTSRKPRLLDIPKDRQLPGYRPKYSLKTMLHELRVHGTEGPPAPL